MKLISKLITGLAVISFLGSCKKDYVCTCHTRQSTTFQGKTETIHASRRKAREKCTEIQKGINDPDVWCSLPEY